MRVVTYNVRGFRDGRERVLDVVRNLAPDVLLLQESGSRHALRRFAEDVDMRVAGDPWSPFRRRVKNAVLARAPWDIISSELRRFPVARRWYPRGALVARLTADDSSVWAMSIHLGLNGAERAAQVAAILDHVSDAGGAPVVVGGDLNATPEQPAIRRIAAAILDTWSEAGTGDGATFPASAPAARIDQVFVSGGFRVVGTRVGAEGAGEASDHLPVAVDLDLDGPEAPPSA